MVVGRHLSDHHGGGHGILVAHIVAHHIAVALFISEDIVVGVGSLPGCNTLGHELETGKGILKVDIICLAHGAGHAGGDNGGQHAGVFRHGAGGLSRADDVVDEQHAELVAGDGNIVVA